MSEPIHKTAEEMRFITWLGRRVHSTSKTSRLLTLKAYRDALLKRVDWRGMDRLAILDHIDVEIRAEESSCGLGQ